MRTTAAARAPARGRPSASTSGPARNRTVIIGVRYPRASCVPCGARMPSAGRRRDDAPHDASYVPFAGVVSRRPAWVCSCGDGRRGFCTETCVRGLGRRRRERGVRGLARRDIRRLRRRREDRRCRGARRRSIRRDLVGRHARRRVSRERRDRRPQRRRRGRPVRGLGGRLMPARIDVSLCSGSPRLEPRT